MGLVVVLVSSSVGGTVTVLSDAESTGGKIVATNETVETATATIPAEEVTGGNATMDGSTNSTTETTMDGSANSTTETTTDDATTTRSRNGDTSG